MIAPVQAFYPGPEVNETFFMLNIAMKFVLLINLQWLTTANSSLLNIAEHENFSANKYETANYWNNTNIRLPSKIELIFSLLSILLYACETWTWQNSRLWKLDLEAFSLYDRLCWNIGLVMPPPFSMGWGWGAYSITAVCMSVPYVTQMVSMGYLLKGLVYWIEILYTGI